MGEPLRVLVYGSVDEGACDFVRLGAYRDLLLDHGVEVRTWRELNDNRVDTPAEYLGRLDDAFDDGVATVDTSPIDWADVLVFRRWYSTVLTCADCDYVAPDRSTLREHAEAQGHTIYGRDRIVRSLLAAIEADPSILRGRAMVYELDDDLLASQPWLGFHQRIQGDLDLIERFARRADLVTVTTPTLASSLCRYNGAVRVVRNAVNPEWYERQARESGPRPLSFLYYGVVGRLHDYAICRDAVDETARATGGRRIWLGSDHRDVRAVVDEALPYVQEVDGFARQLAAMRPAIGLAPVGQDAFSRGHSELHWLEYSLAGAATVASRTMGGGPYDVIRDGVDGLLARNKAEWRESLRRLAASPQMRDELVGRARERVLAEYDVRTRAAEWADAFHWAADHAGRGALRGLTRGLDRAQIQDRESGVESEARANLAHRRMTRSRSVGECETLVRLRGDREVCWPDGAGDNPLVSVVIPTSSSGRILAERSLVSVLNQTYRNLDVVVVADHATDDTLEAIRTVDDPRVRFENLSERSPGPIDPEAARLCAASRPFNRGLQLARGSWIAPGADDDEFTPDHVETLLSVALEHRLEFVYGDSWVELLEGPWVRRGEWPPRQEGFHGGTALYSSALRYITADEECWRDHEPSDWNVCRRIIEAGARAGHIEHMVLRRCLRTHDRSVESVGAG